MKRLNQYEESIEFIKNNTVTFVKKAYGMFSKIYGDLYEVFTKLREKNPEIAYHYAAYVFGETDFFKIMHFAFSKKTMAEQYLLIVSQLCRPMYGDEGCVSSTADYDYFDKHSGNIYAPLRSISGRITQFGYIFNTSWNSDYDIPAICVSINQECAPGNYSTHLPTAGDGWTNHDNAEAYSGMSLELFDNLESTMYIDIKTLFQLWQRRINLHHTMPCSSDLLKLQHKIESGNGTQEEIDAMLQLFDTKFNKVIECMNSDETATNEIYTLSRSIVISGIATYLTFAGKTIGAINDIYRWAYSSFVKDSADALKRGEYPGKVDIVNFTREVPGENLADDNNGNMKRTHRIETSVANETKWTRSKAYTELKLQYSNWAAVLNVFFKFRSLDYMNVYCGSDAFKELLDLGRQLIMDYLGVAYRTFNTPIQINLNNEAIPNQSYIKNVTNILSPMAKAKIRDYFNGLVFEKDKIDLKRKLNGMYIGFVPHYSDLNNQRDIRMNQYEGYIAKAYSFHISASNTFADAFMMTCYLILMNTAHENASKMKDEVDYVTGRNKFELFEEIYTEVKRNLAACLRENDEHLDSLIRGSEYQNIDDYIDHLATIFVPQIDFKKINDIIYTDILPLSEETIRHVKRYTEDIDLHSDGEYHNLRSYKEISDCLSAIVRSLYEIPPFTEIERLRMHATNNSHYMGLAVPERKWANAGNARMGRLYPKNKVVLDSIRKLRLSPSSEMLGIESLNEMFEQAKNAVEAGDFACMYGNVIQDLSKSTAIIETDPDDHSDEDTTTDIPLEAVENTPDNVTLDANGNIFREHNDDTETADNLTATTDSYDTLKAECFNNAVTKLSKEFNQFFAKYILS